MKEDEILVMIVEDDSKCRSLLETYLSAIPGIRILSSFGSAEEAYPQILTSKPELLFLDVELPGKSGISLLGELRQLNLEMGVIFTTAYDHYAIPALKNAAFDYLLKPIDKEELLSAVTRFKSLHKTFLFEEKVDLLLSRVNPAKKIRFNTRRGFTMINPDDIIYCRADWNYTELWIGKDQKELVTMNIGKIAELLAADHFCRAGRSLIINTKYIEKADRKARTCYLKAGNEIIRIKMSLPQLKKIALAVENRFPGK